jgi:hypothetical protein
MNLSAIEEVDTSERLCGVDLVADPDLETVAPEHASKAREVHNEIDVISHD